MSQHARSRRKRSPWQRIMRAADRGTGMHLSADDVLRLSEDGALAMRAALDDELWDECPNHTEPDEVCPWCGHVPRQEET